jgi:hypothetical protein
MMNITIAKRPHIKLITCLKINFSLNTKTDTIKDIISGTPFTIGKSTAASTTLERYRLKQLLKARQTPQVIIKLSIYVSPFIFISDLT